MVRTKWKTTVGIEVYFIFKTAAESFKDITRKEQTEKRL